MSKELSSDESCDEESICSRKVHQRKIGPGLWADVPIEKVASVPEDINGLRVYEIEVKKFSKGRGLSYVKDGRNWKKDSETQWKGYGNVRYSDCKGSYHCNNQKCDFRRDYGVTNRTQFNPKTQVCSVCNQPGVYVACHARRYVVFRKRSVRIYHCGQHTCPCIAPAPRPSDNIRRQIEENPNLTPSQIQSNAILKKIRTANDWSEIEKAARDTLDRKWIANEKQRFKQHEERHGHNFEAVVNFKQFTDQRDPYYVFKLNDSRGNPDRPSFVFKTSKLKAKFALNMDRSKDHFLSEEFCYFDGKVKRCKGFTSLTASVYHPLLRKMVPLATMECESEDSTTINLFWTLFNEVLQKENGETDYVFNPKGWCTDMAGANIEGLRRSFGPDAVERIKTCEFHFKDCRNKHARRLQVDDRSQFKELCNELLNAASLPAYDKAKENLDDFIGETPERNFLSTWVEWWHRRRKFIFHAFFTIEGAPKMNHAELIHASWVKRDKMNMTLLDAAHADVRDNVQLEVEHKSYMLGGAKGGSGPSLKDVRQRRTREQLARAKRLGEELLREDIPDEARASGSTSLGSDSSSFDSHNASTSARRSSESRNERFRSTRSKVFQDRLARAREDGNKVKCKILQESPLQRIYCIYNSSALSYRVVMSCSPSCTCPDYQKNGGKELCKHIIWTTMFVLGVPEDSHLMQQITLTRQELSTIFHNAPTRIPDNVLYSETFTRTCPRNSVQDLLRHDRRFAQPQVWKVIVKEKKKGPSPRCRGCRSEQQTGHPTLTVRGLYVPFQQQFVTETLFYFCPNTCCVARLPPWTNLRPPSRIFVEDTIGLELKEQLKLSGLPII